MSLSDVVNVSITRDTATVSTIAFDTIALLSSEVNTANKIEFVSSLEAAKELLTGGSEALAYTVLSNIFMQNPHPSKVALIPYTAGDVVDALDDAVEANNNWYYLVFAPVNNAAALDDMKSIADWIETKTKVCGLVTKDATVITDSEDATSIAAYLKSKGYARTYICYDADCDDSASSPQFINAGIASLISTWTPGSYTCKFKKLSGVAPSNLTSTQLTNAENKNVNTYISVAGRGMFQHGVVAEGEWIDTIVFCDWIKSQIEVNVFSALINNKKIPFDDVGIGIIESKISAALEAGISSGGFTQLQKDEDGNVIGGYVIMTPKASEISANDKNARKITSSNPIRFIGFLSGAIHAVTIQGSVTV
jgi:hypothetical protein